MKIEEFEAGIYRQQYQYKSFTPHKVNEEWTWSIPSINVLLEEATKKIGELHAFSSFVPNVDLFILTHCVKEAQSSSKIEGTETGFEEALFPENEIIPERRNDWQEVQNYIKAINFSIEQLETLPLSNRLLCDAHKILLSGVRGNTKNPGEFRKSQNWIGGASISDATFIPPNESEIPELMSDLEKFLHNQDIQVPYLIRIAIAHYQFETIHPYLDGNGRIGRLLITLYLISSGVLTKPTLYLSDFFERNKSLYYDNLSRVRSHNNLLQWIKFFLVGISETATRGISTFQRVMKLKEEIEGDRILELGSRAKRAKQLLELLYQVPAVNSSMVASKLGVSPATATNFLNEFHRLGILTEVTGFKRNKVFVFREYLDCFEEKKIRNAD